MTVTTVSELKKTLVRAGFEVYRTRGDEVQLAERVRDNLIMDSGVSLAIGERMSVRFVVRAQRSDFPNDAVQSLYARARELASGAASRGFTERDTVVTEMNDPADPSRTLDTWYEVRFEKVAGDVAQALEEARFALAVEKVVRPSNG